MALAPGAGARSPLHTTGADALAGWKAGARPLSPAQLRAMGAVLVVAPHPDDESLGCGGLIARLCGAGVPVHIVAVSDGTQSHPGSRRFDAAARRALRQAELVQAAAHLGVPAEQVSAMGLPDGAVPGPGHPAFAAAAAQLLRQVETVSAMTILAPWRHDPHTDHRASHALARCAAEAAQAATGRQRRLLEYFVWTAERAAAHEMPQAGQGTAWQLDIAGVLPAKRGAIAAHRSQCGDAITDDPQGFTLPAAMRERALQPAEYFFEAEDPMPSTPSLPPSYFDDVYRANADPWSFETSAYESAKYDDTLHALPGRRFERGFEIGCSIGVLTERLAPRCAQLLAVDVSDAALQQARRRCAALPQVTFENMQVPQALPAGRFDLVLMSEVAYYWQLDDLHKALDWTERSLLPGGLLLLVHWTPEVADYPLRGDTVHDTVLARQGSGALKHAAGWRRERYRLDLFQRR